MISCHFCKHEPKWGKKQPAGNIDGWCKICHCTIRRKPRKKTFCMIFDNPTRVQVVDWCPYCNLKEKYIPKEDPVKRRDCTTCLHEPKWESKNTHLCGECWITKTSLHLVNGKICKIGDNKPPERGCASWEAKP